MTTVKSPRSPRRIAALFAFVTLLPAAAQAQVAAGTTSGLPSSGVLQPPQHVDPKMSRHAPRIPARSMPVIHPKATARNGTLVVPR